MVISATEFHSIIFNRCPKIPLGITVTRRIDCCDFCLARHKKEIVAPLFEGPCTPSEYDLLTIIDFNAHTTTMRFGFGMY